jgi:hypothetical protein
MGRWGFGVGWLVAWAVLAVALALGLSRSEALGAVYPARMDTFVQQGAKLVGTNTVSRGGTNIQQGSSVALSGDGSTALIGGPYDHGSLGAAWVFNRSGSMWSQRTKLVGPDGGYAPQQGFSVAVSADGNTALVGAPNPFSAGGRAWVFTRQSGWYRQAELVGSDAVWGARQGYSVALSGDGNTALVGGPDTSGSSRGAAWVFIRSSGVWFQQAKLSGPFGSGFGTSVGLSSDGNTALIGNPIDGPSTTESMGAVWVFTRAGSTWSQQGRKLVGTGAVGAANQGQSVALSGDGDTALVGGPADNNYLGAAWVFTRSGSTWVQQGSKLVGTEAAGAARQGSSAALSGDGNKALIGGPRDGSQCAACDGMGAAWVFTRSGSTWSEQGSKLVGTGAVGPLPAGQGSSVALSGDGATALVGGPRDNNSLGAAWAFVEQPAPTITLFTPTSGITGTIVTITGTDFSGASSVTFRGLATFKFTVRSPTQITATVPNGARGGKITVTTPAGSATSTQDFKPTLSIIAYRPTSGFVGTSVDIQGIGFAPTSTVKFNSTPATAVTYINPGEIQATVPAGATSGPITLTTTAGTVQARGTYTVTTTLAPRALSTSTLPISNPLAT